MSRRVAATAQENFTVVVRIRPPLDRELEGEEAFQKDLFVDADGRTVTVAEDAIDPHGGGHDEREHAYAFTFDRVYDMESTQAEVYEGTARPVVASALSGYNATIFAYGPTGTGKTYTMEGVFLFFNLSI